VLHLQIKQGYQAFHQYLQVIDSVHQRTVDDLVLQFQVDAFHVQEASGQAPKDYLQEDERQGAPSFRLEDGLEQRFSNIHLKDKGRFPIICLALFS
jgi:hypothetical protein